MPLVRGSLRIGIDNGDRVTVLGELAGEDDRDGRLAASAFRVCHGEDARHLVLLRR